MEVAAVNGRPEIVDILLAAGHDIERKNDQGNTALLICAQRGDVLGFKHLLNKGADLRAVNVDRMNARDVAEELGHAAVVDVIDQF